MERVYDLTETLCCFLACTSQLRTKEHYLNRLKTSCKHYCLYNGRAINSDETHKQHVSSQWFSYISQLPRRSTPLALVILLDMLDNIVEVYTSNRLPTSTLHIYLQHVAIFNQHSSPFLDSSLIPDPLQMRTLNTRNLIEILAIDIIYLWLL